MNIFDNYNQPTGRLVRNSAERRGASGPRDPAVVAVSTASSASSYAETGVVKLSQHRVHDGKASSKPARVRKHQLQMRVDSYTRAFIGDLMKRSEAESVPEVVRLALREYERVWFEFDGNIGPPEEQSVVGAAPVGVPDEGEEQSAVPPSQDLVRLNIVLAPGPMARLKRLVNLTEANSQAEVIRYALCVLDVRLDEFDRVVSGKPNVSILSEVKDQIACRLHLRRKSVG